MKKIAIFNPETFVPFYSQLFEAQQSITEGNEPSGLGKILPEALKSGTFFTESGNMVPGEHLQILTSAKNNGNGKFPIGKAHTITWENEIISELQSGQYFEIDSEGNLYLVESENTEKEPAKKRGNVKETINLSWVSDIYPSSLSNDAVTKTLEDFMENGFAYGTEEQFLEFEKATGTKFLDSYKTVGHKKGNGQTKKVTLKWYMDAKYTDQNWEVYKLSKSGNKMLTKCSSNNGETLHTISFERILVTAMLLNPEAFPKFEEEKAETPKKKDEKSASSKKAETPEIEETEETPEIENMLEKGLEG